MKAKLLDFLLMLVVVGIPGRKHGLTMKPKQKRANILTSDPEANPRASWCYIYWQQRHCVSMSHEGSSTSEV